MFAFPRIRQRQFDAAVDGAAGDRPGAALIRGQRLAGLQVDHPIVQRAGDAAAVDDALRQRPVLVRAAVDQREHLVVLGAEDGDVALAGLHHAGALARHVVNMADVGPDRGLGHDLAFRLRPPPGAFGATLPRDGRGFGGRRHDRAVG